MRHVSDASGTLSAIIVASPGHIVPVCQAKKASMSQGEK